MKSNLRSGAAKRWREEEERRRRQGKTTTVRLFEAVKSGQGFTGQNRL
jgi:hypothetical protein